MKSHYIPFIPPAINLPPVICKKSNQVSGKVVFHKNVEYDIGLDQKDWNKLIGLKKKNHEESVRIGWRYFDRQIQFNIYVRANNDTFSKKLNFNKVGNANAYASAPIIKTLAYNKVNFNIKVNEDNTVNIVLGQNYYIFMMQDMYDKSKLSMPWFGGNKLTPKFMTHKFLNFSYK